MTDILTPEQRHKAMSHIRAKNTRPEMWVRQWLHKHGFRYRLHVKELPGKPDIVLPKYRSVVFVNGCFWHGHMVDVKEPLSISPNGEGMMREHKAMENCRLFVMPKTRTEFWQNKITNNQRRDKETIAKLQALGWQVYVLWECHLRNKAEREIVLIDLVAELREGPLKRYQTPLPSMVAEDEEVYRR